MFDFSTLILKDKIDIIPNFAYCQQIRLKDQN